MYGKVIDISHHQKAVDFNKVKAAGYKGAIIRLGYRGYGKAGTIALDSYFITNIAKCKKAGLPIGIYFFSQATTKDEAIEEAKFTVDTLVLNGVVPDFPVYIDSEYGNKFRTGRADKLSKSVRTECVKAFCECMESNGYYVGIYASTDWLNNQLDMSALKNYDVWVAHYASKCGYKGAYGMWQFTSKAAVPGVNGNCDCSYCYKNYPNIISTKMLNGNVVRPHLYDVVVTSVTKGDMEAIQKLAANLYLTCIVKEVK